MHANACAMKHKTQQAAHSTPPIRLYTAHYKNPKKGTLHFERFRFICRLCPFVCCAHLGDGHRGSHHRFCLCGQVSKPSTKNSHSKTFSIYFRNFICIFQKKVVPLQLFWYLYNPRNHLPYENKPSIHPHLPVIVCHARCMFSPRRFCFRWQYAFVVCQWRICPDRDR